VTLLRVNRLSAALCVRWWVKADAGLAPELQAQSKGEEVFMAKLHARPSAQYRYEHYDPRFTA
jgi:hypothetical protein